MDDEEKRLLMMCMGGRWNRDGDAIKGWPTYQLLYMMDKLQEEDFSSEVRPGGTGHERSGWDG